MRAVVNNIVSGDNKIVTTAHSTRRTLAFLVRNEKHSTRETTLFAESPALTLCRDINDIVYLTIFCTLSAALKAVRWRTDICLHTSLLCFHLQQSFIFVSLINSAKRKCLYLNHAF